MIFEEFLTLVPVITMINKNDAQVSIYERFIFKDVKELKKISEARINNFDMDKLYQYVQSKLYQMDNEFDGGNAA